ncbi:hypothetical protein TVAG_194730 [Trichomonas vaginalis G3]|uniref:Uncharacterized protein n=1 Tax=Trichomonas vaginalis (strain ATCC PRA-98 / G3) TaxID=412133 RepID=A2FL16_TRIV3|nr:hypothetical protein TVAGG3_1047690 [Trichomonas vaginalis G3]EAX94387.1 hypothetical protein TVAG_194730 [Trichomonas vaginalis G3]KAI5493999.1 hypothetical protein TVAGG3_1047690 [Trichomonas vaginalis G3]|eukprot:XP_001307317.1 hypothetical protein [Trichomonas vaginalis G3]
MDEDLLDSPIPLILAIGFLIAGVFLIVYGIIMGNDSSMKTPMEYLPNQISFFAIPQDITKDSNSKSSDNKTENSVETKEIISNQEKVSKQRFIPSCLPDSMLPIAYRTRNVTDSSTVVPI